MVQCSDAHLLLGRGVARNFEWRGETRRIWTHFWTEFCRPVFCTVVAHPELLQCRAVVKLATNAETTSSPSVCESVTNWYHTSSYTMHWWPVLAPCCAKRDDWPLMNNDIGSYIILHGTWSHCLTYDDPLPLLSLTDFLTGYGRILKLVLRESSRLVNETRTQWDQGQDRDQRVRDRDRDQKSVMRPRPRPVQSSQLHVKVTQIGMFLFVLYTRGEC